MSDFRGERRDLYRQIEDAADAVRDFAGWFHRTYCGNEERCREIESLLKQAADDIRKMEQP